MNKLFEKVISVNEIKNRIVMGPMGTTGGYDGAYIISMQLIILLKGQRIPA